MSGIAGIIDFNKNLVDNGPTFASMLHTLSHRGPDGLGTYVSSHAALGAAQLALAPAPGLLQPMTRRLGDYTYTIVCNAELYNSHELRRELHAKKHTLLTDSDTELILAAYLEWGASSVEKFRGCFTFAIWEENTQKLFLARDQMGTKPLYFAESGASLIFASEIKAILAHPDISPRVNADGIMELFALAPSWTPGTTPFAGIEQLKPGECMFFSRLGVYRHQYWKLKPEEHTDSVAETVETVRDLIKQSLISQLNGNVACFLSGGIDSSSLCGIAAEEFAKKGKRLMTFSIEYEDNAQYFNKNYFQSSLDTQYIESMCERIGSDHHVINIGVKDLFDALAEATRARDLPGMADVDSSLLLACREVKEYADVVISGECADEIFLGYPWFHREDLMYQDCFPWSGSMELRRNIMGAAVSHLPIEEYTRDRYLTAMRTAPVLPGELEVDQQRRQMCSVCLNWFGANLIDRKDRMSMASGLQARMPFADPVIAQYVFNIPWDMKNMGGLEKGVLRAAMSGVLPESIATRKKTPYPKTYHPKYLALTSGGLLDILNDPSAPIHQIINERYVREMIANKATLSMPWFGQLMTGPQLYAFLIQVNQWLKEYKIEIDL